MNQDEPLNDNKTSRRNFVIGTSATLGFAALNQTNVFSATPAALNFAEAKRSELIELMSQLVSIRSQTGESAEVAQKLVKNYLSKLPYRVEQSEDRPSKYQHHDEYMTPNPPSDGPFVNIVGWPEQEKSNDCAIFSHIDTHTVEDGWDTDPYKPVVKNNRMYGLGTADDKGGVAAMLIAAKVLSENNGPLPVVMSLHGKGGGSRGSLPIFERIRKSDHNIKAVLYAHPAETGRGLEDIKNAVQGVFDLEIKVEGWRGRSMEIGSIDSAAWDEGGNAINACVELLNHLRSNILTDTEVNLGRISGGDRIGSVADKAIANVRLKFTGKNNWSALLKQITVEAENFIKDISPDTEKFEVSVIAKGYRTNPGEAEWQGPESIILRDSIASITGQEPKSYPNHYAGDIRYPIRLLNVPAYGIGSLAGNFYGPNEWVDIDDLVKLTAVLIDTVQGWSK
ncbi:MAG: acetylornithine deacetylase [Woeseiaceae bacterium]|jgi:acetylornithine deacetylase|tara:strand:+ start:2758 stop:4113 length:1356 start_codon:yes stop_codon:yes gene_type:complete